MAATARSMNADLYQNHRFKVIDTTGKIVGGFNFVGLPEVNVDMGEYREGLWTFPRKYPLRPHFQPISLHRGITKNDTSFYKWIMAVNMGKSYRTDLIISQFHRSDVSGLTDYSNSVASRSWKLHNCMPIRFRSGSDLDSSSPDISIQEIDLEIEYFTLFVNGQEQTV